MHSNWQMDPVQQVAWLYIGIFVAAAVLVGAVILWKKCIAARKSEQVTDMHAVAPVQAPT